MKSIAGEYLFKAEPKEIKPAGGSLLFETVKQFPSALKETIMSPLDVRGTFEKTLTQVQSRREEKQRATGQAPSPVIRYFAEELGKETVVTVTEIAKSMVAAPFKIVKSFRHLPSSKGEVKEPEWKVPILGNIDTYAKDAENSMNWLTDQGMSADTAALATVMSVGGSAILDVVMMGQLITAGATRVASGYTAQVEEKIASWKLLGSPATEAELKGNFKQLAKQFHPDLIGGNEAAMMQITSAESILSASGLPTRVDLLKAGAGKIAGKALSPISRILEMPTPKTLPLKKLTIEAGKMPDTTFKGYQPAAGLSLGEFPSKAPGGDEFSKYLQKEFGASKKLTTPLEKALEPLIKEAVKYASAEEFVKAQPISYHGTTPSAKKSIEKEGFRLTGKGRPLNVDIISQDKAIYGDVLFFTDTPQRAKVFAGQSGRLGFTGEAGIVEVSLKDLKLANPSDAIGGTLNADNLKLGRAKIDDLKARGFDGLQRGKSEKIVWNIDKIKTKSQLTDIYNQATGKVTKELVSKISPNAIMPPREKYAFNINVDRLKLTDGGKEALNKTVEAIKPELERIKGKPLSHKEVLKEANKVGIMSSSLTREQQLAQEAEVYNLRTKVTELSNYLDKNQNAPEVVWEDYVESLKTVSAKASEAGRMLESLKLRAGDKSVRDGLIEQIVEKTDVNVQKIVESARTVDFDNLKEAQAFYREFVKPSFRELIDEYRYINMLSSPKTNIVNALGSLLQTPIIVGTKLYAGGIDAIGSKISGKERQAYVREIKPYIKGYVNSISEAFSNAKETFAGKTQVVSPKVKGVDVFRKPAVTKGIGWTLKTPLRAMEAADMFFHTLFKAAEKEALAYQYARTGKQIVPEEIEKIADDKALYTIFRGYGGKLKPEHQGKLLNSIDSVTEGIYSIGQKVPLFRWVVPFIQTPMEVLKQGIELSPFGLADFPGAEEKTTKLARVLLGLTVMGGATALALDDRTTWAAPSGEKERQHFYASGRKPYAVKIGDKWISYSKIGSVAYSIAWVAAVKHYSDERGLDEEQSEVIGKATMAMAGFFSDQSYMEEIGNILKAISGADWEKSYYRGRTATNIIRQLIPYVAFQGWLSRILDDTYRDPETAWETIKTQLPLLSKSVEPYTTPTGEESKRDLPLINALSPFTISTEDPFYNKLYENYTRTLEVAKEKREAKAKAAKDREKLREQRAKQRASQ